MEDRVGLPGAGPLKGLFAGTRLPPQPSEITAFATPDHLLQS